MPTLFRTPADAGFALPNSVVTDRRTFGCEDLPWLRDSEPNMLQIWLSVNIFKTLF
jgi:hypothetical protein